MKNTLGDLNNHLFAQLERLSDEDLKGEQLSEEISRSKAVTAIASQIISTGSLALEAKRLENDKLNADVSIPKVLKLEGT